MREIFRNSIKREWNKSMSRIWRELSTLKLTIISHQSTIRLALSREPIRLLPDFKRVVRKN